MSLFPGLEHSRMVGRDVPLRWGVEGAFERLPPRYSSRPRSERRLELSLLPALASELQTLQYSGNKRYQLAGRDQHIT